MPFWKGNRSRLPEENEKEEKQEMDTLLSSLPTSLSKWCTWCSKMKYFVMRFRTNTFELLVSLETFVNPPHGLVTTFSLF